MSEHNIRVERHDNDNLRVVIPEQLLPEIDADTMLKLGGIIAHRGPTLMKDAPADAPIVDHPCWHCRHYLSHREEGHELGERWCYFHKNLPKEKCREGHEVEFP